MLCYCNSGLKYENCCHPYHKGDAFPPNAEALMRSRYSAYVTGQHQYICDTYSEDKRRTLNAQEIANDSVGVNWLHLLVEEHRESPPTATVTFKAFYAYKGKLHLLHERSNFTQNDNQWFYVDGVFLEGNGRIKLSKNEPCFCGSGKKFKVCCEKRIRR